MENCFVSVILTDEVLDAGVLAVGACLLVSAVAADAVVALQQSARTSAKVKFVVLIKD